eukprot:gene1875-biopygen1543
MSTPRPPCPPPGPGSAAGERKRPRSPSATPGGRRAGGVIPRGPVSIPPLPTAVGAQPGGRDARSAPSPVSPRFSAAATARLEAAVRRIPADLDALRGAVADGAAVTTVIDAPSQTIFVADKNFFRYNGTSALSLLIRRGELEAVLACLKSPKAINFKSSANILSPIEEIAMANTAGWPEYNRRVLSAVVDRIARHPSDMVDWPMKEYRTDLLSLAAKHQLLSVFWPVLKRDVTYFADQTEPIPLTPMVWAADWAALGPEEQQCFNKDEAVYMDADAATSRLCVACFRYPEPDYAAVDECVSAGADVMFDLVFSQPLLNSVLWDGSVKLVEALLRTPRRIDFSKESHLLGTPLHFITQPWLGVQKRPPGDPATAVPRAGPPGAAPRRCRGLGEEHSCCWRADYHGSVHGSSRPLCGSGVPRAARVVLHGPPGEDQNNGQGIPVGCGPIASGRS